MKTLRLVSTLFVLAVLGLAVYMISPPRARKTADPVYGMQMTKITASTGAIIYTGEIALETEAQLKTDAENESTNGVAVLIGTGSTDTYEPVTDIEIVGIGGVAYGNIHQCPKE